MSLRRSANCQSATDCGPSPGWARRCPPSSGCSPIRRSQFRVSVLRVNGAQAARARRLKVQFTIGRETFDKATARAGSVAAYRTRRRSCRHLRSRPTALMVELSKNKVRRDGSATRQVHHQFGFASCSRGGQTGRVAPRRRAMCISRTARTLQET
jgi:hypothetical protein